MCVCMVVVDLGGLLPVVRPCGFRFGAERCWLSCLILFLTLPNLHTELCHATLTCSPPLPPSPCPHAPRCLQALLQRLESRVSVKGVSAGCCAGLLRRLFPRVPAGRTLERYPPRIFLSAYMVLAHPGGGSGG